MCGRYALDVDAVVGKFNIKFDEKLNFSSSRNIAPGSYNPVIISSSPINLALMKWGIIPSWAKDERASHKMINARAETLFEKPSYKSLIKSSRCLVPASGFYEWKKEGKTKTPYYFSSNDDEVLTLGGLFSNWKNFEGVDLFTYTIITVPARGEVSTIHDRMPLMIEEKNWGVWLENEDSKREEVSRILQTERNETMKMEVVGEEVFS